MTSLASAINWTAIETFIGFGPPNAPNVFIGMEEGLDKDADLGADLRARSAYAQYMDLLRAQISLGVASKYVGPNAICQRTWRPIADLMLRLEGKSPTLKSRNAYQGERLGRIPGKTLLCELLPYPRQRTTGTFWEYQAFGRFSSFEQYRNALLDSRIKLLGDMLRAHNRKLIVCYGKEYWPDYKRLVQVKNWEQRGRFQFGKDVRGTVVVLSLHFSGRAFNREEQCKEFYGMVVEALARL